MQIKKAPTTNLEIKKSFLKQIVDPGSDEVRINSSLSRKGLKDKNYNT